MPLSTYNAIRDVVWHGDLYRLANPRENDFASLMYVNEAQNRAVMFNYMTGNRYGAGTGSPIKLKGLNPDKKYKVKELNLYPETRTPIKEDVVYSGDYLMTVGFNPALDTRRTSVVLELTQVK